MAPRKAAALKKESQTAASPIPNLVICFRKSNTPALPPSPDTQEKVKSKPMAKANCLRIAKRQTSEGGADGPCAKRGQAQQGTKRRRTSAKLAAVVQTQSQENVNAPSPATRQIYQTETDR
jgi:hypothetical protein